MSLSQSVSKVQAETSTKQRNLVQLLIYFKHKSNVEPSTKVFLRIFLRSYWPKFFPEIFDVYNKKRHTKEMFWKQLNITFWFEWSETFKCNVTLGTVTSAFFRKFKFSSFSESRENLHFKLHAFKFNPKRLWILKRTLCEFLYEKIANICQTHFNIFHFDSLLGVEFQDINSLSLKQETFHQVFVVSHPQMMLIGRNLKSHFRTPRKLFLSFLFLPQQKMLRSMFLGFAKLFI